MERGGTRESGLGGQGPDRRLRRKRREEGRWWPASGLVLVEDTEQSETVVPMQCQVRGLRATPRNLQIWQKQRQKQRGPHFDHIIPEARYPRGSELLLGHLYTVLPIERGFLFVALRVGGVGAGRSGPEV